MRVKRVHSEYAKHRGGEGYQFRCPGCDMDHIFWTGSATPPSWGFNGSLEKPTFTPSLLVRWHDPDGVPGINSVCHSFVTDGKIQFLDDCTHKLKGRTADLYEIVETENK